MAWKGPLNILQPGLGYVYVSQAQTTKMVTFWAALNTVIWTWLFEHEFHESHE